MRIWTHISVVKTTKARKQLMRLSLLYREFSELAPLWKRALKRTKSNSHRAAGNHCQMYPGIYKTGSKWCCHYYYYYYQSQKGMKGNCGWHQTDVHIDKQANMHFKSKMLIFMLFVLRQNLSKHQHVIFFFLITVKTRDDALIRHTALQY